ncbi:hypothetical protein DL95DRAFT_411227 [Leptodontidium sp. 2 PMI_412]|nr:hypothetical protein DL95DRAFT_411227 [Leptodontidium sp. 2 PMI_412]
MRLKISPIQTSRLKSQWLSCRPYQYPDLPYGPHIIGIDLGESYSRVGVVRKDLFRIAKATASYRLMCPFRTMEILWLDWKPRLTLSVILRVLFAMLGRNFSDPEVQEAIKDLPYEIVEQDGRITIRIHTNRENKVVTPEEVLGITLQHLVHTF